MPVFCYSTFIYEAEAINSWIIIKSQIPEVYSRPSSASLWNLKGEHRGGGARAAALAAALAQRFFTDEDTFQRAPALPSPLPLPSDLCLLHRSA